MNERPFAQFGKYLIARRQNMGFFKQSDFCRATGISSGAISYLEHGQSKPSPETLNQLSRVLDDDRDFLYLLAGYWPPSIQGSRELLGYIRQTRPDVIKSDGTEHQELRQPQLSLLNDSIVSGEKLRTLRGAARQRQFAKSCGLSQSYLSSLETGRAPLRQSLFEQILKQLSPQSDTRI